MAAIKTIGLTSIFICAIITIGNFSIATSSSNDIFFDVHAGAEFLLLLILSFVVPLLQSFFIIS